MVPHDQYILQIILCSNTRDLRKTFQGRSYQISYQFLIGEPGREIAPFFWTERPSFLLLSFLPLQKPFNSAFSRNRPPTPRSHSTKYRRTPYESKFIMKIQKRGDDDGWGRGSGKRRARKGGLGKSPGLCWLE